MSFTDPVARPTGTNRRRQTAEAAGATKPGSTPVDAPADRKPGRPSVWMPLVSILGEIAIRVTHEQSATGVVKPLCSGGNVSDNAAAEKSR
jgi:hypothetical protein